mgnify:CR=1 FL=1
MPPDGSHRHGWRLTVAMSSPPSPIASYFLSKWLLSPRRSPPIKSNRRRPCSLFQSAYVQPERMYCRLYSSQSKGPHCKKLIRPASACAAVAGRTWDPPEDRRWTILASFRTVTRQHASSRTVLDQTSDYKDRMCNSLKRPRCYCYRDHVTGSGLQLAVSNWGGHT